MPAPATGARTSPGPGVVLALGPQRCCPHFVARISTFAAALARPGTPRCCTMPDDDRVRARSWPAAARRQHWRTGAAASPPASVAASVTDATPRPSRPGGAADRIRPVAVSIRPGVTVHRGRTMTAMNRALLVIDVQESFRARPTTGRRSHNPDIAEAGHAPRRRGARAGDLVVWVLHSEPGSETVFDPELGQVRLMAELERSRMNPLSSRHPSTPSPRPTCSSSSMQHGVRELVDLRHPHRQCCETTARVASDLGFEVTFVTDATTTSGIDGLSAEEIIDAHRSGARGPRVRDDRDDRRAGPGRRGTMTGS